MSDLGESLGLVAVLLSIAGTLAAGVAYLTRLQIQGTKRTRALEEQLHRLEAEHLDDVQRLGRERQSVERQLSQVEGQVSTLTSALASARQKKEGLSEALQQIEKSLAQARGLTDATSDAILVRDPFDRGKLLFLAAHGDSARKIRSIKVPVDASVAGSVLKSGEPRFHSAPSPATEHYSGVDSKAGHSTKGMVTLPLSFGADRVGVVQLLNKTDGGDFSLSDVGLVEHLLQPLASCVNRLNSDPDTPRILGFPEPAFEGEALALFADITNSSRVLSHCSSNDAATILAEYIERLCDVGLRFGGSIDRYLGDGFLLRFNVPQPLAGYAGKAVECAMTMQREFAELQAEWTRQGRDVRAMAHRIGIGTGWIVASYMGRGVHRSYTIIGPPVNLAAKLNELARTAESGVLICPRTQQLAQPTLRDRLRFEPFDGAGLDACEMRAALRPNPS